MNILDYAASVPTPPTGQPPSSKPLLTSAPAAAAR